MLKKQIPSRVSHHLRYRSNVQHEADANKKEKIYSQKATSTKLPKFDVQLEEKPEKHHRQR